MIPRTLRIALVAAGLTGFVVCILVPLGAIVFRAFSDWHSPAGGYFSSSRQWTLLAKTLGLATVATVTSIALSPPGAFIVGRHSTSPRPSRFSVFDFRLCLVLPLLLPPMIVTFGWQRLLGAHTPGFESLAPMIRCVLIWSAYAWPIPAIIIGAGWSRAGRDAYEAALLESSPPTAFRRAVVPVLRRHVGVSALILLIIFLGEYTVPHANGLTVVATELLVTAHSARLGDCLRQSIPLVASVVLLLVIASRLFPGTETERSDPRPLSGQPTRGFTSAGLLVLAIIAVTLVIPITALAWRPSLFQDLCTAYRTYRYEVAGSLAVSFSAAVTISLIGVTAAPLVSAHRSVPFLITLSALLPGPLIGEAVIAAYQFIPPIYDHWPILVIALAARYAWVGLFAAWLAGKTLSSDVLAQATIDGADESAARISFQWRQNWPTLLAGLFIAASLSLSDISVIAMVQVPDPRMLSTLLMEKFHRFETGMLVAISLCMLASILPGAILTSIVLRRRNQ